MNSFRMNVISVEDNPNINGIIHDYSNEFSELFQDCNFTHNIKISYLNDNIYQVEYPENDINFMYKYLCDNDILPQNEMCEKLNFLFANPADVDWWTVFGLKGNILDN